MTLAGQCLDWEFSMLDKNFLTFFNLISTHDYLFRNVHIEAGYEPQRTLEKLVKILNNEIKSSLMILIAYSFSVNYLSKIH